MFGWKWIVHEWEGESEKSGREGTWLLFVLNLNADLFYDIDCSVQLRTVVWERQDFRAKSKMGAQIDACDQKIEYLLC